MNIFKNNKFIDSYSEGQVNFIAYFFYLQMVYTDAPVHKIHVKKSPFCYKWYMKTVDKRLVEFALFSC